MEQNYHIHKTTGVIQQCDNTSCSLTTHYININQAINNNYPQKNYTDNLDLLLKQVSKKGFYKAQSYELDGEVYTAQLELLLESKSIEYFVKKLDRSNENEKLKLRTLLMWCIKELSIKYKLSLIDSYKKFIRPFIHNTVYSYNYFVGLEFIGVAMPSDKELLNYSSELWLFKNSLLHYRVKNIMFNDYCVVADSSSDSLNRVEVFNNKKYFDEFSLDVKKISSNIIAFDVEVDTTNGYGLLPHRSKVTEIVLSNINYSYVFSGDEKFILKSFADTLNSLHGDFTLIGWNNYLFDNIFLQTRAEIHNIDNWCGWLSLENNYSNFEPCGPTSNAYALNWSNNGSNVDVFQQKVQSDLFFGSKHVVGLKPFVVSMGGTPIMLDRNTLHELSEEERVKYVLSDGLSTLFSYQFFNNI